MACKTCPFAFTEESEMVQNYGCLPEPSDIVRMKRESGHNWGCHSADNVKCKGFKEHVEWMGKYEPCNHLDRLTDIDTSVGGIISYEDWYHKGEEEAIKRAEERYNVSR